MVLDLRAINQATSTLGLPVPDPYVAIRALAPTDEYFSEINLANALFCLPLALENQEWFAFTYEGKRYTYTRLPQGFKDSPELFNQALHLILAKVTLPEGVSMIQYKDDLLLGAPTAEACLEASKNVLTALANAAFKVKKEKCQLARKRVVFLGRLIGQKGTTLTDDHQSGILRFSQPGTVQKMLAFLGLCGYSRTYVLEYVNLTQPLRELINKAGHRSLKAKLEWTRAAEEAFTRAKQELGNAAHLATPDYEKPFHLDVSETEGIVNAALYQKDRGGRKTLSYYSCKLDSIEKGQPACARHLAALAKTIEKTAHIVLCHPLIINTNHGVSSLVAAGAFSFSNARKVKISGVLTASNISYQPGSQKRSNMTAGVNGGNQLPHDCIARVK